MVDRYWSLERVTVAHRWASLPSPYIRLAHQRTEIISASRSIARGIIWSGVMARVVTVQRTQLYAKWIVYPSRCGWAHACTLEITQNILIKHNPKQFYYLFVYILCGFSTLHSVVLILQWINNAAAASSSSTIHNPQQIHIVPRNKLKKYSRYFLVCPSRRCRHHHRRSRRHISIYLSRFFVCAACVCAFLSEFRTYASSRKPPNGSSN